MKKITLLSTISFLLIAQASLAAPDSLYEKKVVWDKKEIKACWGDELNALDTRLTISGKRDIKPVDLLDFTDQQKDIIKNIIEQEYTPEKTGISFTGFENCTRDQDYDAVIYRIEKKESTYGRATIGQNGHMTFDGKGRVNYEKFATKKKAFVLINTINDPSLKMPLEDFWRMTALHEFGHLAGLRHEHARIKEARVDLNCKIMKVNLSESTFNTSRFEGPYDPNSVMNYCYLHNMAFRTGTTFEALFLDKMMNLTDPSLYTKEAGREGMMKYHLEIKLSQGDKNTLKAMYKKVK